MEPLPVPAAFEVGVVAVRRAARDRVQRAGDLKNMRQLWLEHGARWQEDVREPTLQDRD